MLGPHFAESKAAMATSMERLEAEALELSRPERARLARRLLESLDTETDEDAEVERAWEEEIRQRLAAYHSGAVRPIPAADVFARARASRS
jgi:putative addiction module component (TIGR02574 family)